MAHDVTIPAGQEKFFTTADGCRITDGARLYNYYDACWVEVHFADNDSESSGIGGPYWNGWFRTRKVHADDSVGLPGSGALLNGERLAMRPPR